MPSLRGKRSAEQASSHERARALVKQNIRDARRILGHVPPRTTAWLEAFTKDYAFSVRRGDLQIIKSNWYVTHSGLVALARRKKCRGIQVEAVVALCDATANRFVLKATVYPSRTSSGFVGYGDADPSNVSYLVQGAEMRVAETRAVNRALRKAYGIGICSVEEIGSLDRQVPPTPADAKKLPSTSNKANGTGTGSHTVRDRLCQVIRQHNLDPNLVKAYAADFCGKQILREATREQVENFVAHLADWAEKDRNALSCQLNSYMPAKEGAA